MEIKRDARIGLAVLLVLALSVTLLIAKAMQRTEENQVLNNNVTMATPASSASSVTFDPGAVAPALVESPGEAARRVGLERFQADHGYVPGATPVAPAPGAALPSPVPVVSAPVPAAVPPVPTDHFNQFPAPPAGLPGVASNPGVVVVAPVVPAPAKVEYTVVEGDSPWVIAKKTLGDGKYFQKILDANPGLDATRLKVGQKLNVPSAEAAPAPATVASEAVAANTPPQVVVPQPLTISAVTSAPAALNADHEDAEFDEYVVKSGDTIGHIAHDYYGYSGPKSVKRIVDANPGLDPRALKEGMRLKIPVIQP
ncbi:MAG: LysM peptidoglycan-binding domain-containing protein [Planctomycetes bacterium]|nr:LysM peptidoglycan-binding domain-containing protein [Planctomycetota bacterium]